MSSLEILLKTAKVIPSNNQVEYVALSLTQERSLSMVHHRLHPYLQQEDLREYCKEKGIVLSAYTPSGQYSIFRITVFRTIADFDHASVAGWDTVRGDPLIVELAKKYSVDPQQVILAWHLARDIVVVTASKNEGRQKDNLKVRFDV